MDGKLIALAAGPPDQASPGPRPRAAELDAAIVARAQRADEAACRLLVERHQGPVFAVISRVLGARSQRSSVPDLAQDTFLRVFRRLRDFDRTAPGRLSSWILTIATRVTLDHLKRRGLDLTEDQGDDDGDVAVPGPEQALQHRQTAAIVEQAVDQLPPGLRAVLLLRVVHELPYEDIARELSLEVGTVKSRLARARAQLWQALAGDQP
jgi:RNA polymerase sigma-70 factor (ECF subfamily)